MGNKYLETDRNMPSENKIKLALLISLAFAILLYHAIEALMALTPARVLANFANLLKVAQIVVTAVMFLGLLTWPRFVRLVLRDKYLGGLWTGKSEVEREGEHGIFIQESREEFEIEQSIFQAVLTGRSYDEDKKIKSIWSGRLYRVEGSRFWFAIELDTSDPTSDPEVGILQFGKQQDHIDGLYHPGNPRDACAFRFFASRGKRV